MTNVEEQSFDVSINSYVTFFPMTSIQGLLITYFVSLCDVCFFYEIHNNGVSEAGNFLLNNY